MATLAAAIAIVAGIGAATLARGEYPTTTAMCAVVREATLGAEGVRYGGATKLVFALLAETV